MIWSNQGRPVPSAGFFLNAINNKYCNGCCFCFFAIVVAIAIAATATAFDATYAGALAGYCTVSLRSLCLCWNRSKNCGDRGIGEMYDSVQ